MATTTLSIPICARTIRVVQNAVEYSELYRQSSVPGALEAGLEACEGPSAPEIRYRRRQSGWKAVLPLVKNINVPVVAISNDDTGISRRLPMSAFLKSPRGIVERAADFGIGRTTRWLIR